MVKKIIASLLLLLPLVPAWAQKNVVDEIIWVVGDEPILLSDVEEARLSAEQSGSPVNNPYCTIPEMLAINKLFLHLRSRFNNKRLFLLLFLLHRFSLNSRFLMR